MKILGIETSFDETAVAIVEKQDTSIHLIATSLASSEQLHTQTGGAIPEVAARRQVEYIIPIVDAALKKADVALSDIDAFAVTYGPGLIGSLLVGVETAKTLAFALRKPLVPVNHLQGHLYVNWLNAKPELPAIGLVVSGGHSDFVNMRSEDIIEYIGGTRDDAAGEAFDKTARLIGLPYPGGPAIAQLADEYIAHHIDQSLDLFPRPMSNSGDLDMSFSGLKTAVLNYTKQHPDMDTSMLAANIQEAIVDTLVSKTEYAINKYSPQSFILSGGVSANNRLKTKMRAMLQMTAKDIGFYVPEPRHSTDNAVMIATAAAINYSPIDWRKVDADPTLAIEDTLSTK